MDPFLAQFGRNVARARKRAGLTQEGLWDLSEIHPTEISRIENGRINVKIKTVERLATVLGVTPGQLLDGPVG
jgi:transcriptional regulator with XRE-family HTH domain